MQLTAAGGYLALLAIAWLLSSHRRRIPWRVVIGGTLLQFAFAFAVLRTNAGERVFRVVKDGFVAGLDSVDAGAEFVFGENFRDHYFAFRVLSAIVFFSALTSLLYHLRLMQPLVRWIGWVMRKTLGTSGAESLVAASNIFLGQTEAPLVVRPYLAGMTRSEIMSIMTTGFSTVAGSVMAAYIGMGIDPVHLLTASIITAPAGLVTAKLMEPETGEPLTRGGNVADPPVETINAIDALASGASDGVKLAINVGAMIIAFLAMIALADKGIAWAGSYFGQTWSLSAGLGWLCWPFAWLMGVPAQDCRAVGELVGLKTVANEFVAYKRLGEMGDLAARSRIIATYALCGFANFGSIGVQIGGLSLLAPERRRDLAELGLRAMIAGNLACFLTACIAGMLVA